MGELYLYQDTETTDLLDFKLDLHHASQPRICALAATLASPDEGVIDELDVLIIPDKWIIEPGAAAVNGLTLEMCRKKGIPMVEALARYNALKARATHRVGWNISYDKRMLAREAKIYDIEHNSEGVGSIDLCQIARPICRVPNRNGINGFKLPKLTEAYPIIMGEPLHGAHTAIEDTRACMEIHFKILGGYVG